MHKVLSIIGARPQFVKEAVLQREILKHAEVQEVVVHTGQHYDANMSGVFFEAFHLKTPDYNLSLSGGSHGEMTGRMLIRLEEVFQKEEPEMVLLYGDTNSTLAGALAAAKLKIPVAHIEAGLRQKPKDMPEEINRVLTDHISTLLFSPSQRAIDNLRKEGIEQGVFFAGDVMYDAFVQMQPDFRTEVVQELGLEPGRFVILTLHRDFNVDDRDRLAAILQSMAEIHREMPVVFPMHPRTQKRVEAFGLSDQLRGWKVVPPMDYLDLMGLTQQCYLAVTDSGGYQKETYFAGKSALVIMEDTSWRELVDAGINRLVEPNELADQFRVMTGGHFPAGIYGDGKAAERIFSVIRATL